MKAAHRSGARMRRHLRGGASSALVAGLVLACAPAHRLARNSDPVAPAGLESQAPSAVPPQVAPEEQPPPAPAYPDNWAYGHGEPVLPSQLSSLIEEIEATAKQGLPVHAEYPDMVGHTLLHRAAIVGRPDLARRLVALGADKNAQSMFGMTPLDLLYQGCGGAYDAHGVMKYLESIGAEVNYYK